MEVYGIALATLISDVTGCLIGCWLVKRMPPCRLSCRPSSFIRPETV
ncbi:hypothetical protein PO124_29400 [Bacillus licheniformis]|nr:hypothetical protein [Bacillus licheniformis]